MTPAPTHKRSVDVRTANPFHLDRVPRSRGDELEVFDRGVTFELPRSRETDMADAIVCDTLGEIGEVDVRLVEGVRQHSVTASMRRAYVVCIAPDTADPNRIRLVVIRFSPVAVGIERAGMLLAGVAAIAVVAYGAIVALGSPQLSSWTFIKMSLLAVAAYFAVLMLARLARHIVERSMAPPSEDETLMRIAAELRATLTRSRR